MIGGVGAADGALDPVQSLVSVALQSRELVVQVGDLVSSGQEPLLQGIQSLD